MDGLTELFGLSTDYSKLDFSSVREVIADKVGTLRHLATKGGDTAQVPQTTSSNRPDGPAVLSPPYYFVPVLTLL